MKSTIYLISIALLLSSACKKNNDTIDNNNPQYAEAARAVGTYQISSVTDANGNLTVYTPQNSLGQITVTKMDATHFHVVVSTIQNGVTDNSPHDYVFNNITGDGYVHFTETSNKSTAQFVDGNGGESAFDIDIASTPNDIYIVSINN